MQTFLSYVILWNIKYRKNIKSIKYMESVNISIIMVAYTAFVRQASQMKQHVEFFSRLGNWCETFSEWRNFFFNAFHCFKIWGNKNGKLNFRVGNFFTNWILRNNSAKTMRKVLWWIELRFLQKSVEAFHPSNF